MNRQINPKILLFESDNRVSHALASVLASLGFQVVCPNGLQSCIDLLRRDSSIHLAIMDLCGLLPWDVLSVLKKAGEIHGVNFVCSRRLRGGLIPFAEAAPSSGTSRHSLDMSQLVGVVMAALENRSDQFEEEKVREMPSGYALTSS